MFLFIYAASGPLQVTLPCGHLHRAFCNNACLVGSCRKHPCASEATRIVIKNISCVFNCKPDNINRKFITFYGFGQKGSVFYGHKI